ncbi:MULTISPECIES: Wzz/FepE/Etk N-terminal domain-containing protein [Pseudoalteromonas]|uniref:Wzz/FepE/Etk N-terminal domain-containing protein n=1 Tax=Pseudoalteromonas TaxID=53246 RepID=UPI000FFEE71D|nr:MULTISPECIES: Wzz/FepE/Etk N-terminal domain-containing protein [Pseudoalteromonas]MCG9757544.1 Wzz/FepE/Etk N-terminal domain-containing protein [Pseudoalteromonas sp. Isolate6]NKC17411.1 LPS O-antigen length regulator [Pseudoalteromonas galatheae]RXE84544.1 LPS O-antigen length regulator [Pseudoalteromonas sp. A757]
MSKQNNEDVSIGDIFTLVKQRLLVIIVVTGLFIGLGVAFALSKANIYQSQVLLSPASNPSNSSGGLSGQLGGLAALAGVQLGGGSADKSLLHLERFKSRVFLTEFIKKHKLKEKIYAAKSYEWQKGELLYDADKLAKFDVNAEEPISINMVFEQFIENNFELEIDTKTGLVALSVLHQSPFVAKEITDLLVKDINQVIRQEEISEANKSIDYLEAALEATKVLETKKMFYQLIEQQHRTKMLASVKEEYAFKVIDPAIIPERKYGPNRALIVVIFALLGGVLATGYVIVSGLRATNN